MLTLPTAGESDQMTLVFVVPPTVAANCFDCPPEREAVVGDTPIVTEAGGGGGSKDMAAVADLVESAMLVALSVTV